jgi:hypothetical protein
MRREQTLVADFQPSPSQLKSAVGCGHAVRASLASPPCKHGHFGRTSASFATLLLLICATPAIQQTTCRQACFLLVRSTAAVGLHVTTGKPAYDRPRLWHLAIARAPRSQSRFVIHFLYNDEPGQHEIISAEPNLRITQGQHGNDFQYLCLLDALRLVHSLATNRLPTEGSVIRHLFDSQSRQHFRFSCRTNLSARRE